MTNTFTDLRKNKIAHAIDHKERLARALGISKYEMDYYGLIKHILMNGASRPSRVGCALSVFGKTLSIELKTFPLLTKRKLFYKGVFGELAAMLRGPKTVQDFRNFGCNYWDNWANDNGSMTLDYGNAWIDWNGVNQLKTLVNNLKNNPTDRRMLISGWRPDKLETLSLPCCHLLYQWYVRENKYLDMIWYQRSVDVMVGLPSDVIFAAAWNILLSNQCGYKPGKILFVFGDTHIYENHLSGVKEYIRNFKTIKQQSSINYEIDKQATVANFLPQMLKINNYSANEVIKFSLNG